MRFTLIALLFILFTANCTNKGSSSKSQQMYNEVMQVHDEVMPKMKDIRQYSKSLKKIENFEENDEVVEAVEDLKDAHESMMDWMAQFDMPKGITEAEEVKYLQGQKISVKAMSEQMYSALEQAEEVLEEFKNE